MRIGRVGLYLLGLSVVAMLAASWVEAAPPWSPPQLCTVLSTVPVTISAPGAYCLAGDVSTIITTGNAITIMADDVVLDLHGFLVEGPGGANTAYGIHGSDRKNVTVRNGTVRGFQIGVALDQGTNHASQGDVVEWVRTDRNQLGIIATGRGTLVRHNQVIGSNVGIDVSDCTVLDNDVVKSLESAIRVELGDGLVVGNRVTEAQVGIEFGFNGVPTSGKYRDNLTFDVTTPFVGGNATNAGNNN